MCDEEGNDLMVAIATIAGFQDCRILVDNGSIVEVLTWEASYKMGLKEHTLKKENPFLWIHKSTNERERVYYLNSYFGRWRAHYYEVCPVFCRGPPMA